MEIEYNKNYESLIQASFGDLEQDEINDIYKPIFHNIIESTYKLFIYDRWGKLVYETTNINEGWDGIRIDNGMQADPSHYTYLARFVTYGNQLQEEIGTFQLIR